MRANIGQRGLIAGRARAHEEKVSSEFQDAGRIGPTSFTYSSGAPFSQHMTNSEDWGPRTLRVKKSLTTCWRTCDTQAVRATDA
eukprot:4403993-Pyramimonas_sp.AAC.1